MDKVSGVLTTTSSSFDRESVAHYAVVIKAADQGTTVKSVTMTLTVSLNDVNDNYPVFDSASAYTKNIGEDSAIGWLEFLENSSALIIVYLNCNTFKLKLVFDLIYFLGRINIMAGRVALYIKFKVNGIHI